MSENVILIAGLPGSGKTTHLCQMLRDGWLVFDDYKAQAFEDCSKFGSSGKFLPLISALRSGLRCAVADIDFCRAESREEAESLLFTIVPGLKLRWLFFENDSSACEANVKSRDRRQLQTELENIRRYSKSFNIPQGAEVLPVSRDAGGRDTEN
ncbi:MAG: hypothetical protein ABSB39_16650 [Candidatus Sulfotelmatobacter sp.]|jgi:hypothetical protein